MENDWKNPDWNAKTRVHDWRNYISQALMDMWQDFTDKQKAAIAANAAEIADNEEWD